MKKWVIFVSERYTGRRKIISRLNFLTSLDQNEVILASVNSTQESTYEFIPEFLNSTEIDDLPPYKLKLKNKPIIKLICNLDFSEYRDNGKFLALLNYIYKNKNIYKRI